MHVGIIATIGPSSLPKRILGKIFRLADIARINTKYGDFNQYSVILDGLKGSRAKVMFDVLNTSKLDWINEQKFGYLAISFCESGSQVMKYRALLRDKRVKIIAKIETRKGVSNVLDILKYCDGLMVARGDLSRHVELARLPFFQKYLLRLCTKYHKIGITATEMLLSMTDSVLPEKAEVSDVANAVLDGSNFLMLSEETAIGKYPVESVKMMHDIISEASKSKYSLSHV